MASSVAGACYRRSRSTPYDARMGYSRDERLALCTTLAEVDPDAPTLCAGWTARVQRRLAERTPFAELIETIRSGPPRLSLYGLPGLDERVNTVEFFVHHEDVRRGQPEWKPRDLPTGLSDQLWGRLKLARFVLRKVRVGVEYAREDEPAADAGGSGDGAAPSYRMPIHRGTPVVTVIGTPAELTLFTAGRRGAAQVRMDGTDTAIQMVSQASWRL